MPLVHSLCTALFSNLGAQTLCCFFQPTKWVTKEHGDKNHNCSVLHHCFPVCLHQSFSAEELVLLRLGKELAKGWQEQDVDEQSESPVVMEAGRVERVM